MTDTTPMDRASVIQYVAQRAPAYGLDAAAVLAVANHEGLNTKPASSWTLPGEFGISFGPPSWYAGDAAHPAAGTPIVAAQGSNAPNWAWTQSGIDYWLASVAKVAQGRTGVDAIHAIVTGFENPAAKNVAPEIANASADYASFQAQTSGATPSTLPPSGTQAVPQTTGVLNPQIVAPAVTTGIKVGIATVVQTLFGGLLGPNLATLGIKPDFSGLILLLASLFAILIGALIWKGDSVKKAAPDIATAAILA